MPSDLLMFERKIAQSLTTTADLHFLAQHRLEGFPHDLIHHKFARGGTLQGLVDGKAVQRWIVNGLEARQEDAFRSTISVAS